MPTKIKDSAASQSKRFMETARELGCDDDEADFDAKLKRIASVPPPKSAQKRKARKQSK